VQKPVLLTTFRRYDYANYIYLYINDLTPAMDGQSIPAKSGQGSGSSSNLGMHIKQSIVDKYLDIN